MKTIKVVVRDKIATQVDETVYVCGNNTFFVDFDFDEEWYEFDVKTARFVWNGQKQDVVFTGNQCEVPIITNVFQFEVGVFAGNLQTTTPALISARKSILCGNEGTAIPKEDVYSQIMEMLNGIEIIDREDMEEAVKKAVEAAEKAETALGNSTWVGFEMDDDGNLYAILSPSSEASFFLDENGYLGVQMNV